MFLDTVFVKYRPKFSVKLEVYKRMEDRYEGEDSYTLIHGIKTHTVIVNSLVRYSFYSAFADKSGCNCHFPASGWDRVAHHRVLQVFPSTSQASRYKTIKST